MQIKKQKKQKSSPLLFIIVALALVAAVLAYYVLFIQGKNNDDPVQESDNISTAKDQPQDTPDSPDNSDTDDEQPPVPTPSKPITITIPFSGTIDSIVRITSQFDELISNGTCSLTLTKDNKVITKETTTFAQASFSSCRNFDIPLKELSSGTWSYVLTVLTTDGRSGKTSGEVSI